MPGVHIPPLRLPSAPLIGQGTKLRTRLSFSGSDLTLGASGLVLLPQRPAGVLRQLAVGEGLIAIRSQLISVRRALFPDGELDIQVRTRLVSVGRGLIRIGIVLIPGCPGLIVAQGGEAPQRWIALIPVP